MSEISQVQCHFIQQKVHLYLRSCGLDNKLNRPSSAWECFIIRQKQGLFGKVEIFHVLAPRHYKSKTFYSVALLLITRRHSKHETRNILQGLNQIYKTLIKIWKFNYSDEIEIYRLPCCWTALTIWNISGGYLTQTFNSVTLRGDIQ